jgi:hypothetical protein
MVTTLQQYFLPQGNPPYENAYRPHKVGSGQRNSELLPSKFICKELPCKSAYTVTTLKHISRYISCFCSISNFVFYIPQFLAKTRKMFCSTLINKKGLEAAGER